jgi:hypothetical protein
MTAYILTSRKFFEALGKDFPQSLKL